MDTTPTGPGQDVDRLSVADAAARLGVTPDAVRARIRRGTLSAEKGDDGVYVVTLPRDEGHDADTTATGPDATPNDALVEQLQSEVAYLRSELTAAREQAAQERERADVLQREALQRIEALTPLALGATIDDVTPTERRQEVDTTRQDGAWSRLLRWLRGS